MLRARWILLLVTLCVASPVAQSTDDTESPTGPEVAVPFSDVKGVVTATFNRKPTHVFFAIQKGWPATERRSAWGILVGVPRTGRSPTLFPSLFDCGPQVWGYGVISLSIAPDDTLLMVESGAAGGSAIEVFPLDALMEGFDSRVWHGASRCVAPIAGISHSLGGWVQFDGWTGRQLRLRSSHALRSDENTAPNGCCDGEFRYLWDPVADQLTALPEK